MKHLITKIILWLFVLPIISLGVVYLLFAWMQQDISRSTFYLLVILALVVPGISMVYGFKKVFGWQGWKELIIGSFLSALIWTVLALIMNRIFVSEDIYFDGVQALIFLFSYFVFLFVIIQIIKVLFIAKRKIIIKKVK